MPQNDQPVATTRRSRVSAEDAAIDHAVRLMVALSNLFLGGRRAWADLGASMIAVDTLVHNFLHRMAFCTG